MNPVLNALKLRVLALTMARSWPQVPAAMSTTGQEITRGESAQMFRGDAEITATVVTYLVDDQQSPVLAVLHPAGLPVSVFVMAWRRLAAEGEGAVAWTLEWMLQQGTPAQRAALTRADYLACLSAPAGDVRFLGQQFVTETYVLPPRTLITRRERLAAGARRLGRRVMGRPPAVPVPWSLPAEDAIPPVAPLAPAAPARTP